MRKSLAIILAAVTALLTLTGTAFAAHALKTLTPHFKNSRANPCTDPAA